MTDSGTEGRADMTFYEDGMLTCLAFPPTFQWSEALPTAWLLSFATPISLADVG